MAWHVAVFNAQAKSGKLQDWAAIRAKLRPKTEAPVAQDWRVRKSERQAQMASLKKHQEMRKRPMKKAHGR